MILSSFPCLGVIVAVLPTPILALATPTLIFSVPGPAPDSWFENLAVRPNGKILATRGDAPEIWQVDPATGVGSLLVSVPGAFNLTGIAQVTHRAGTHPKPHGSRNERYVFASAYIPAPFQVDPGSARVWTLEFNPAGAPSVSLLAALPQAGFLNGLASWDSDRVVIGDTVGEAVYLMNANTGAFTTPLANMSGINGVQTTESHIYWANHNVQSISRIPVNNNAVPTGPAEILSSNQSVDDFALGVDKVGAVTKLYIGAMYDNAVVEASLLPSPASRVVASNLTGTGVGLCAVVVFGRRAMDKGLLYASVAQGGGSVTASIVSIDPAQ